MNVIALGNSITLSAIIRECTLVTHNYFVFEFRFPGGKVRYGGANNVTFVDNDTPVSFEGIQCFDGYSFVEGDQANINIYHFPVIVTEALLLLLVDLQTTPVADGLLSLKTKLTGYTFELVYRGLVYCTAETVYFPYNPIAGDYETIEKAATIYKTR